MARIREALRCADSVRGQTAERVVGPRPYQPQEAPLGSEVDEEIPFIEVGGRDTPLEASPSVLASTPKALSRQELPKPCPGELKHQPAPAVPATEARPTRITFRPFPPEAPRLRPVAARFAPELVAIHQPDHPLSEQYRVLVQQLEEEVPAGQSQALLFLAATPQSAATAVLLNLAISCARHDTKRVVVVDANLHRPLLAERLGLPAAPGLGELLAGKLSLACAVQETGLANLYALTGGKTGQANPCLGAEPMGTVLRQLRTRFDRIFVNAPCWDGRPEQSALATACDAIYLVLPEADAESDAVQELSQRLVQQGGQLRGYLLLASDSPSERPSRRTAVSDHR